MWGRGGEIDQKPLAVAVPEVSRGRATHGAWNITPGGDTLQQRQHVGDTLRQHQNLGAGEMRLTDELFGRIFGDQGFRYRGCITPDQWSQLLFPGGSMLL